MSIMYLYMYNLNFQLLSFIFLSSSLNFFNLYLSIMLTFNSYNFSFSLRPTVCNFQHFSVNHWIHVKHVPTFCQKNLIYAFASRFLKNLEEIEPCVIHWSEWRASRRRASVSSFWHVRIISAVTHLLTRDVDKWISRWTEGRGSRERTRKEENLPWEHHVRRVTYPSDATGTSFSSGLPFRFRPFSLSAS